MSDMLFDPNAFLDQTTDQVSERRMPVPALDYLATIEDVQSKVWTSKDKYNEDGTPKSGLRLEVSLKLDLPAEVQAQCGLQSLKLTDGIMADLTPDKRAIDYSAGKNGRLRVYREATGLNIAGQPFSPRMLVGRMVRVRVAHEEYQGNIQERVGGVAKAS